MAFITSMWWRRSSLRLTLQRQSIYMSAALVLSILRNSWRKSGYFMWNSSKNAGNRRESPFAFVVRLMKSAIFSNVVYPICRHGCQIIHYTPGKRWDSLYTWDSGMIGIGMLEYSTQKAEYVLDTYLSEKDNQDFAFLFHGSMVPTQFYLFYELLRSCRQRAKPGSSSTIPCSGGIISFSLGKARGLQPPGIRAACLLCTITSTTPAVWTTIRPRLNCISRSWSILWLPFAAACIWCASQNSEGYCGVFWVRAGCPAICR